MPRYDVTCSDCGTNEREIPLKDFDSPVYCYRCGREAVREFPLGAIRGFQPFESYYDEVLECDINGRREKRQILNAEGLIEAGDKRGGARNFDRHAPDHIKPRPPKGISYASVREHDAEQNRLTLPPDIQGEGSDE